MNILAVGSKHIKVSRIYLVGFMGVGKSTVGKQLANILGYKHLDLDAVFEQKYKINIDLFFKKYGEALFREIEYNLLLSTFDLDKVVVSTGGGTVTTGESMDKMVENGFTVYLEMPVDALVHRLANAKKKRPLLDGKTKTDLVKTIELKLAERAPFYNKAHLKLNAVNIDAKHLAKLIQKKY